jgi:hypothetical protein
MKTIIKNYDELIKFAGEYQVTVQQVINQRLYNKEKGWSDVIIDGELRSKMANEVSQLIGGRQDTRDAVDRNLFFNKPKHWGLERIVLEQYYGDNPPRWAYIAGQDYPSEIRTIRNYLK